MIRTRSLILSSSDVPTEWGFEFYLKLAPLTGADQWCLSPFTQERTPSCQVYKDKAGKYRYRDFSSGSRGDLVDLVARLKSSDPEHPLDRKEALRIIQQDFQAGGTYTPVQQLPNSQGRVVDYQMRTWTQADFSWWNLGSITPYTLERYNVSPIKNYVIEKLKDGVLMAYNFQYEQSYGYFDKRGNLLRLYNPGRKRGKFVKVLEGEHLQGWDYLRFKSDRLLIQSSLKDIMCLEEMNLGVEGITSDGEGILISKHKMEFLRSKYPWVGVLMDDDSAGQKATLKYVKEYPWVHPIYLKGLSKDPWDSVKDFGQQRTRLELLRIL